MSKRPVVLRVLCFTCIVQVSACAITPMGTGERAGPLDRCVAYSARAFPNQVTTTLRRVEGTDRQLLALRSYLRNRDALAARWSWPQAQIARFVNSSEYRTVQAELAKITAQFEKLNPGYTLYVNSQVRSLDTQIALWNENSSVANAARELAIAAEAQLSRHSCRKAVDPKFEQFVSRWRPTRTPLLAAPGLSKHGQARAFDFQIKQGGKIVARPDSSHSIAVWDKKGWTGKLRDAVMAASTKFTGPLKIPYEPWHYEYDP